MAVLASEALTVGGSRGTSILSRRASHLASKIYSTVARRSTHTLSRQDKPKSVSSRSVSPLLFRGSRRLLSSSSKASQPHPLLVEARKKSSQKLRVVKPMDGTVAVVAGAGSCTAKTLILSVLRRSGSVIALSSRNMETHGHPKFTAVKIDRERMDDPSYIGNAVKWGLVGLGVDRTGIRHLMGINLIGGAVAGDGETLMSLNHDKPLAFAHAIRDVGAQQAGKVSIGHISSIAASINAVFGHCDYAVIKDLIDKRLIELDVNGNVVILRPGIVLPNPTTDGRVHMGHDWSPEQQAYFRLLVLIGSGEQIQQPVSEDCLYHALLNGLETESGERVIADAVGSETLTQKRLFRHFNKVAYVYLHVPMPVAHYVAQHYPLGRIAPYSARMFETLESHKDEVNGDEFARLHGDHPLGMSDVYPKDRVIVARNSPIWTHAGMIASSLFTNPSMFGGLLTVSARNIRDWDITSIKE